MDLDANRKLLLAAVAQIATGDRAALQTAYRLTSAKLFGVCLRICGERAEAEDVLQEVYLTVWQKAATFDAAKASPMTWLIAIARNKAIDRIRSQRNSRNLDPIDAATEVPDSAPLADDSLENSETAQRLHECLGGLSNHERSALRGAFFEGSTYEELAARMSVPLGTMKSWIRRAMMKLKTCLGQ
jgi:RNA polymerase sigma-70 factor (ECF subfamily)